MVRIPATLFIETILTNFLFLPNFMAVIIYNFAIYQETDFYTVIAKNL